MKDAYSFDLDDANAKISYNKMFSYLKTFKDLFKAIPMPADTGPIGGDLYMNLLFSLKLVKVKFIQIKIFLY